MKKCNNKCRTASGYVVYYTPEKSPSPLGLGWCVNCGPVGEKRVGFDGNIWIRLKQRGRKLWSKISFRFNPIVEYIEIENCLLKRGSKKSRKNLSVRKKTPKKKRLSKKNM